MKIVALGGGSVDETSAVDKFIVSFAGKEKPHFLFLPTASGDGGRYINGVKRSYKHLGCSVDALCLIRAEYSFEELVERIGKADIIYAGGGNTLRMLETWKKCGILPLLKAAAERGAVMCGTSAGAMCWFSYGYSDCDFAENPDAEKKFRLIEGLGFIPAVCCPHYDDEGRKALDSECSSLPLPSVALENDVALVFDGKTHSLIRNDPSKKAWKFSKIEGVVTKQELSDDFTL